MKLARMMLLVVLSVAATNAPAAEQSTTATPAYREAFGPPPKTEGQKCTAAVVFFPGIGASGSPQRLSPLPVFLLNPDKAAEQAARVAVEGYPTEVREFRVPALFPEGSMLSKFKTSGSKVTVDVATHGAFPSSTLAYQALAHTLAQFGLKSVILRVEGRPAVGPVGLQPGIVEPPPLVRLLDVVAPVHKGEKSAEIDVLFDRPLTVTAFSIRGADGSPVPGTTSVSMFDMAVVFQPKDSRIILRDAPFSVSWTVQDKAGKSATGSRSIRLRIYERPE